MYTRYHSYVLGVGTWYILRLRRSRGFSTSLVSDMTSVDDRDCVGDSAKKFPTSDAYACVLCPCMFKYNIFNICAHVHYVMVRTRVRLLYNSE